MTRSAQTLAAAILALLTSCGPSRTLVHTDTPANNFDNDVRARWSLGMTPDQVRQAADRIKLLLTTTEDARALREIDPSYESDPVLLARITRPGISIDARYFQAQHQIGWLYFFFDDADRLRNITYRLSDEQEQAEHIKTRIILPREQLP